MCLRLVSAGPENFSKEIDFLFSVRQFFQMHRLHYLRIADINQIFHIYDISYAVFIYR